MKFIPWGARTFWLTPTVIVYGRNHFLTVTPQMILTEIDTMPRGSVCKYKLYNCQICEKKLQILICKICKSALENKNNKNHYINDLSR